MAIPSSVAAPSVWPSALLWDVDGTLAETELDGHRRAFNRAFREAGLPWHWEPDRYLQLLRISGGHERLRAYLQEVEGQPADLDRVAALQRAKQRHYAALVAAGELALRPGVQRLMQAAAAAGVRQAIVTTSGRQAVLALLERLLPRIAPQLEFLVCGEDVSAKKPDPEAYRLALGQLQLPAARVLAVEDSANGLAAAVAAGLPVLVSRSAASRCEPAGLFSAATAQLDHLGDPEQPCQVLDGPACPERLVTLSWLQQLRPDG